MAGTELPPSPASRSARRPPPQSRWHRYVPPDVARILARSFHVWTRTLLQLLVAVAIVHVPLATLHWLLRDAGETAKSVAIAFSYVDLFAGSKLIEAFVVQLVFQQLRGAPVELGRSIATGCRRIATILGIALLLDLPNLAEAILGRYQGSLELPLKAAIFIANLVMLLLYCVAAPVAIVERRGVLASLRRSRELSRGHRGTIFGAYFLFGFVMGVAVMIAGLVEDFLAFHSSRVVGFLLDTAGEVIVASYSVVLPIVLYHELREAKEGIGLDEIAAVFD
jgi:hypothetical protein